MKKLLIKFTTLIIILAFTFSLAGCGLFNSDNDFYESNNNQPIVQTLNNAEFGRIEGERVAKNKVQVISEIRGAVVSIRTTTGSGSGVIVDMSVFDEDGKLLDDANDFYILTCHHVVDTEGEVIVYLPDAELDNHGESDYDADNYTFKGEIGGGTQDDKAVSLVGGDKITDVALLKLTVSNNAIASKITKVKFPPSSDYKMMVGEDVIAIGNPGGDLPGTVSTGTISYINRETLTEVGEQTLLQIDAHISHGSSGGGLFNMYGEIIGITSAGRGTVVTTDREGDVTSATHYEALNFAIPYVVDSSKGTADLGFMNIAEQLLESKTTANYGYVVGVGRIGEFGFQIGQTTYTHNVQVTSINPGSIADKANLEVGDIIRRIVKGEASDLDGAGVVNVTSIEQVTEVIKSLKAGDKLSLRVQSSSGNKDITMTASQYIFCDTGNLTK